MPTTKKRINISVEPDTERMLAYLAKRDAVPEATKAAALLRSALEIEEDQVFDRLATARDTTRTRFIPHDDAWK